MTIAVNRDYLPVVYSTFLGKSSDTDVKGFLVSSDGDLARREPYTLIIETSRVDSLSGPQRRSFADWIARNNDALKLYCVAQAYVVPGVVQRMIIRSIFMMSPLPCPHRIFASVEEAWSWCIAQLEASGARCEARVREFPAALAG